MCILLSRRYPIAALAYRLPGRYRDVNQSRSRDERQTSSLALLSCEYSDTLKTMIHRQMLFAQYQTLSETAF
jgi:hypothetical protein